MSGSEGAGKYQMVTQLLIYTVTYSNTMKQNRTALCCPATVALTSQRWPRDGTIPTCCAAPGVCGLTCVYTSVLAQLALLRKYYRLLEALVSNFRGDEPRMKEHNVT